MNRLRELIANFEGVCANSYWHRKAVRRENLEDYLMENSEALADMIDAAQKHLDIESIASYDELRAALSKLTEN
jgi:hypothetical protein